MVEIGMNSGVAGHTCIEVIHMVLTQKETMLLQDLKTGEQTCIDKYERYAADACDRRLGSLFWELSTVERGHLAKICAVLEGRDVMGAGQSQQVPTDNFKKEPAYNAMSEGEDKNTDEYLCRDALQMEKHISALYDTVIFECTTQDLRDMLNHIQKDEQNHGKRIYDYMSANGMYS